MSNNEEFTILGFGCVAVIIALVVNIAFFVGACLIIKAIFF